MNKRPNKSENRNNGASGSGPVLSRLTIEDLKVIKVVIYRRDYVPGNTDAGPIERNLGDPASLLVHKSGKHSLFARNDIVINVEEHSERRTVLKSPRRSRSKSYHSRDRYSRSPVRHSRSKSPAKYQKKNDVKQLEYMRNVESVNKDKTVEYRSSEKKSQEDGFTHFKLNRHEMYKERSPRPSTSKKDYERSSKERRDSDSLRKGRRESPKGYDKPHSPSPSTRKYKYVSDKDRYARRSLSPRSRKHSRSPYPHRSHSPMHSKIHSRSPHYRRSPRDDRGIITSSTTKTSRRSASYEKLHLKRRSVSPYSRRRSRSPHGSRRRSRSPPFRHSDSRKRNYSRSPSKHMYKHISHPEGEYIDYQYYGAEGYWIPGPIHRPGFVPRGAIPSPMFIPRGAPYMVPRPYLPMQHQFRPRFNYNQPYRPRHPPPALTTTSATTPTSNTTTTIVAVTSGSSSVPIPIIEEVSDSDKVDSTMTVTT